MTDLVTIVLAGEPVAKGRPRFVLPVSWPKWRKAAATNGATYHTSRPDADNLIKAAGDALNEVVWRDDCAIACIQCTKLYSDHPSLTIIVEPLAEPVREAASKPAAQFGAEASDLFGGAPA